MSMAQEAVPFDRTAIEKAFERLGEIATSEGRIVDLSIYGGSALLLTFDARVATRDVDAVFENDRAFVRRAAAQVASENGWRDDWINDGVKWFLSTRDHEPDLKSVFRTYPSQSNPGLRVFVAAPGYLFAMKSMAMRVGGADISQDVEDLRLLGTALNIRTAEEAITLVASFYPNSRIPPKTQFGLQEIFGTPDLKDE